MEQVTKPIMLDETGKDIVQAIKDLADVRGMDIIPVQELPDPATAKKAIYLVPAEGAEEGNLFDEYIVVDGKWEKFGSGKISLENYYTKEESDGKFADGADLAGYVNQFANELKNKQSNIGDLDAIRAGAAKGSTALQKSSADELYQPIGQYTTRTEVINLINEYLKWGDGLLTLTYNSEENQETILFNKSVLDNAEIIEIDGTEVDASAFTIRNISGPRLSSSDSITNEMANYRFAEAGEHIIRIKYTAKNLGSYSFWNSPKLMAIELPARITTIDADAVAWLGNLASILLSDNITSISDRFCYHCPSLVTFAFPNKISVVSNAALTGCSALSILILGKSMTAENITTGDNVGAWSLGDLFGLTNIYINGDNPKFTTSLSAGSTICFWNAGRDVPAGAEKSVYYEGNGSFPETLKTNTWLRGWSFYERGVKIN